MQACWEVHGEEIKAKEDARWNGKPHRAPWGELVFEKGMTPMAALLHEDERDPCEGDDDE